ncbi:Translation initiation factor eIF-2B subunit gamma, partial [Pseudolycoriella hygida]
CFTRSKLEEKVDNRTLYTDTPSKPAYNGDTIRCYATKLPSDMFGTRVNTTQNYYAINQKIIKIWPQLFNGKSPSLISPNSTIKSTQITECAVGDGTLIAEKTSLKNSVLGRNCQVTEKVRIYDSVLMNGVVVEERVVLESCVVCDNVVIKSGSILKFCLIGPNFTVAVDTKSERVHLTNADGFMEIE